MVEGNGASHLWTIFQTGKLAIEDVAGVVLQLNESGAALL